MWEEAVRVLATLHQVDASRFPFLAAQNPTSGLADHLAWWRRYLDDGSAGSPVEILEEGHAWLLAHLPEPAPTGFSWGDSRFANIMFRHDRVVAIFDWDTASLAGAEADLAWWRFMDGPAAAELPGIGSGDELVQRWEEHTGRKVRDLEWNDVFTSYRLGVVMLNLFRNMAADELMPADVANQQGRNSGPSQLLVESCSLTRLVVALGGVRCVARRVRRRGGRRARGRRSSRGDTRRPLPAMALLHSSSHSTSQPLSSK
jgi:aminoglycoside phosphotransferase (APT) family kinase protein